MTNNIRVRSVVGRFLEHSRIVYLRWGETDDDEALFLSSADWMVRNMLRRIELAWPIRDAAMRQRVIDECLVPYLHDTQRRLVAAVQWQVRAHRQRRRERAAGPDGPLPQASASSNSSLERWKWI